MNFDDSCPDGYVLAFSNGDGGNPVGGAYCGADTAVTTSSQVASLIEYGGVFYGTAHYWNRHLACYVHEYYTSTYWNSQVIGPDFQGQAVKPVSAKSIAYTGAREVSTNTGASQFGYRANFTGEINTPVFDGTFYYVGTSYLIPRRLDCPKPYPDYP
ncbi:MAG: hypothetical protein ACRDUW_17705 [Pseudonocardiaceae bacterium]